MMKNQKGFTLIELLIVIAIIGLLAALALVSLTAAQQRARDTKRVADMKSFQTSLELYYNENSYYPEIASGATDTWEELASDMSAYISSLSTPPTDTEQGYFYIANDSSRPDQYFVGASLEDDGHQVLSQDIDGTVGGTGWVFLDSSASSFNGTDATANCADDIDSDSDGTADTFVYCLGGSASQ